MMMLGFVEHVPHLGVKLIGPNAGILKQRRIKIQYSSHISSFDSKVVYNNCSCSLDAGFTTSAPHNISESCLQVLLSSEINGPIG